MGRHQTSMEAKAPGFITVSNPGQLPITFKATVEPFQSGARSQSEIGVVLDRDQVQTVEMVGPVRVRRQYATSDFDGIAVVIRPVNSDLPRMRLELRHRRNGLCIPLLDADDLTDIVAEWQLWAKALALPLLMADEDTGLSRVANAPQRLWMRTPCARRKKHGPTRDRPRFLVAREPGNGALMKPIAPLPACDVS